MAGTARERIRGLPRVLLLCAVLCGLFLMHGSPADAAEGCHGAMSAPALAGPSAGMPAEGQGAAVAVTRTAADARSGPRITAMAGGHEVMCLATVARERIALPPPGALAAFAVPAAAILLAGRSAVPGRSGRRAPPRPGGRGLLLQVCVART